MRNMTLFIFFGIIFLLSVGYGATLNVPGTYSTIRAAIAAAQEGDTIVIADGTYKEDEIRIDKSLRIGSNFILDGKKSHIDATIIDGGGGGKAIVTNQGIGKVEVTGLTITGARKLLQANSELDVHHCNLVEGSDQVSFENASFGRVANCTFEGASDDAIDCDSAVQGSGRFIEILDNDIKNCGDDGIEMRLYRRKGAPLLRVTIEGNSIVNVGEDGIQFIDERAAKGNDNSRIIEVIGNLIVGCDAVGIACMPEQKTIENFGGAPGMEEPVYVINNTIVESRYGITGGDNMVVLNCIIKDNTNTGIKRVKGMGIVDYTIFENNGTHISGSIEGDTTFKDENPQYNLTTYKLEPDSFSINRGTAFYSHEGVVVLDLPFHSFNGIAPDLGAFESGSDLRPPPREDPPSTASNEAPEVDAGEDEVIFVNTTVLNGKVRDDGLPKGEQLVKTWRKISGPGRVTFSSETSETTNVVFSKSGIYQLKLSANDGHLTSNDKATIRYAKDGDGGLFEFDEDTLFIEAEDYSYLYGTGTVITDSAAEGGNAILALDGQGTNAFADYRITTREQDLNPAIWIRFKGSDTSSNSLKVEFRGSITVHDKMTIDADNVYRWKKVDGIGQIDPGNWTLRIKANEDGVIWDRMVISTDPSFSPIEESDFNETENFVAYWDMEEGQGFTAFDLSGNGNHAVLSGTKFASPKFGNFSLRFDGFNDYAQVEDSPTLDHSGSLTVSAWVRPDDLENGLDYPFIITKRNAFRMYLHRDRRVRFHIRDPKGIKVTAISRGTVPDKVWSHIVGIFDGSNVKTFVNGRLESTRPFSGSIDLNDNSLFIGAGDSTQYFFNGKIDHVKVYNRALRDQEILDMLAEGNLVISPPFGTVPLPVTADASIFNDLEKGEVMFQFDFGDGTVIGPQLDPKATHTYKEMGTFRIEVRIAPKDKPPLTISKIIQLTDKRGNLVSNPSFEIDTHAWRSYRGPTLRRIQDGTDGEFSLEVKAPSNSLAIFGVNDSPNWKISSPAKGIRYRFSAEVKSKVSKGLAFLRIREYLNESKVGVTTESTHVILSPNWETLSVDYTTEAAGSKLDFQILNDPLKAGEVFQVDEVLVKILRE